MGEINIARRAALFGVAAVAAAPAVAVAAPHADAELVALGQRLSGLYAEEGRAWEEAGARHARAVQIAGPRPSELRFRSLWERIANGTAHGEWFEQRHVDALRERLPLLKVAASNGSAGKPELDRAEAVIRAHDRYVRRVRLARAVCDVERADRQASLLSTRVLEVERQICAIRANTPAGLRTKASVARHHMPATHNDSIEEQAIHSLIADILANQKEA